MKNLKRYKIFESVQLWERIDALTYFKYAYSETEMPAQSGLEIQKLTDDKYSVQYYLAQNSFLFDFTDESNGKEDMKTVNIRITKKTNGSLSNIMTELVTYYTTDDCPGHEQTCHCIHQQQGFADAAIPQRCAVRGVCLSEQSCAGARQRQLRLQ
jgi:hypothetical protein